MIRNAALRDLAQIEDTYNEHFRYEEEHGAFTRFKKGVYPTKKDAEKAIKAGAMYVYEENQTIDGSVIIDKVQPEEYDRIPWSGVFSRDEVMVIHLLMVRPSRKGNGIATALLRYAMEFAKSHSCKAIRLDTGRQNIPAVSLYQKSGFRIAAVSPMKVGGAVPHKEHLFMEKMI